MNERLTIQDFTDLLASKHNMTKKDAEDFVKEFFLLIEQALENEKYIKIKGLGTFKLINVDSTESVNESTGEQFKTQEHSKISFTPDTNLKEAINKPFAHFETVILNENTLLEDTPTDEIAAEEEDTEEENLADIENYPKKEQINTENLITETIPAKEDNHKEMKKEEFAKNEDKTDECAKLESLSKSDTHQQRKSYIYYLTVGIVAILLLCGGVVFFVYYPDIFPPSPRKESIDLPINAGSALLPEQITDTVAKKDTISEVAQELKDEVRHRQTVESKEQANPVNVYSESVVYQITGTKTRYTIQKGETLTKVSLRFFGTKAMWPYIVKHNSDVIKDPDNVPFGTTIKIPELIEK
ncbi:HU family DNA-binding protein [Bacteroides pyogenes]|uniref:HU family DNA-binding protein n=1 Tax=Bacteroides pyogenes TaxID=310300 RepID=UPI0003DBAA11|nr:HU family DNA-binding protein [Bacteroides pyogenes]MBB3895873.1 nucleoid DNA-binding protein [Bacteroides pyogenes]GAE22687.1 putative integration host factor IHF alpha subunit [Bacteroides pyogenes JCM 10003]SUV34681.1 integration host factor IHF subunit alpha [Bacteroides pyogenes]